MASVEDDAMNAVPREERTKLEIRMLSVRDGLQWKQAAGVTDLVIHASTDHVAPGDRILVYGKIVEVGSPTNPGQLDFRKIARSKLKLTRMDAYHADAVVVEEASATPALSSLQSKLRRRFNQVAWTHVDPEHAGLASAILLGNREQLSQCRRSRFLHTGTVHLLAISGLHVGILASVFFLLFRIGLLGRRTTLVSVILFVLFYAWLVEFRPPVCRAAILLTLYCLGKLIGKSGFSFNLLAVAGVFVLLLNPSDVFSLGPQLSFLAVATMIAFRDLVVIKPPTDPLQALIYKTRPLPVRIVRSILGRCRQAVLVSALIWLVAAPLVAFHFHLVAPVALIVNPVLLLPITFAIYGGLGVMIFGGWCSPVADLFGAICETNLGWLESMVNHAESLPLSHWWTAGPADVSVLVFYILFVLLAVFFVSQIKRRWVLCFGFAWVVFGWLVPFQLEKRFERQKLQPLLCTFVDVGHGTSTVLQTPEGFTLLYDAGSLGSSKYAAQNVSSVLWSEDIEHLDAVVISHADIDHFNAIPVLSRRFSIGCVYVTPVMFESESAGVVELLKELKLAGIPVRQLAMGDRLKCGACVSAEVLSPPAEGTFSTDNSDSVVLMLEAFGHHLLLPGDLEKDGMQMLLGQDPIDCDIVMSPHHGSRKSQQAEFQNWSKSEYCVISSSRKRLNAKTCEALKSLGTNVCPTGLLGAVRFVIDEHGIEAMHWDLNKWRPIVPAN